MKKLISIFLVCLLLFGCSAGEENLGTTYVDDLGRKVSIDVAPQRVASLLGSFSDLWVLAGGELVASADDAWDDFALELDAVNLGKTKAPSLEKLLESDPDLVLASTNTQADLDLMPTLEGAGIPVLYLNVSNFQDYLRVLDLFTQITGKSDRYKTYGTALQSRIEDCVHRCKTAFGEEPPKVLFLRASASSIRAKNSKGNVTGEMLADLGCVNIADSEATLLENLSLEQILLQDPDHIFFVQSGDDTEGTKTAIESFFTENPGWQELTAIKTGKVHFLDKRLFNLKPNAWWADAYEQLEEILCENLE